MENFSIFANYKKKAEIEERVSKGEDVNVVKEELAKKPDFSISFKEGDEYKEWGACWWKKDSKGRFYQSCAKSKR